MIVASLLCLCVFVLGQPAAAQKGRLVQLENRQVRDFRQQHATTLFHFFPWYGFLKSFDVFEPSEAPFMTAVHENMGAANGSGKMDQNGASQSSTPTRRSQKFAIGAGAHPSIFIPHSNCTKGT
jgi:hypothetical protein